MIPEEFSKSLSVIRAMLDVSAAAAPMIGQPGASPTLAKSVPLMVNAGVEMIDQLRSAAAGSRAVALEDEDKTDFLREAVERELARREAQPPARAKQI